jgi:hypothetical protein
MSAPQTDSWVPQVFPDSIAASFQEEDGTNQSQTELDVTICRVIPLNEGKLISPFPTVNLQIKTSNPTSQICFPSVLDLEIPNLMPKSWPPVIPKFGPPLEYKRCKQIKHSKSAPCLLKIGERSYREGIGLRRRFGSLILTRLGMFHRMNLHWK